MIGMLADIAGELRQRKRLSRRIGPSDKGRSLRAQIPSNPNCRIGIESSTPPVSSFTSR